VCLRAELGAPEVERVIEHETVPQHLVIVDEARAQAERCRQQAGRLRCEIRPLGVGATDEPGEFLQSRLAEVVIREEAVEAATIPAMG
jgi:hypothetical protein